MYFLQFSTKNSMVAIGDALLVESGSLITEKSTDHNNI